MACPDSKIRTDPFELLCSGSVELAKDLRIFRKSTFVVLREDELSVDLDVENSTAAGDEFGNDVVVLLDPGRQTGGLRLVVSTRAVGNSDLHRGRTPSIGWRFRWRIELEFSSRPAFAQLETRTTDIALCEMAISENRDQPNFG
jgi:hypothetical protein